MSKRFTDTEKWRDPWFCSLNNEEKIFWSFLLDTCNMAGIWQVNWPLVSFYIPNFRLKDVSFKDRIQKLNDEKWFIPKFVKFQYGELQKSNRLHQRIIFELEKEGVSIPLKYPSQGVKDKDKEEDKDKVKVKEGVEGEILEPHEENSQPTPGNLLELWNREAPPSLPRVSVLSPGRKAAAMARLREHPEIEYWNKIISKIKASKLLRGDVVRQNGEGSWKCTFDWILKPNNLAKIEDGNYDNGRN